MVSKLAAVIVTLALISVRTPAASADGESELGVAYFEKHVRPLLIEKCYQCHSAEADAKIEGGLRLDFRGGWEKGGDSGPALVPGKVETSLLIRAVRYRDPDLQMPPKKKLSDSQIGVLEQWVAQGAIDPREAPQTDHAVEPESTGANLIDIDEGRRFWSFQPPQEVEVPSLTTHGSWASNAIDAFLLDHWKDRGAAPAPPAAPGQLVRRLAYALTGLPPATLGLPLEAEDRPDARERVIDRLLASPRYGERWGRHWLDVSRFADSNGMDENMAYVQAYRYRDYVIDAFNADLPFDRFAIEQVAGDLLERSTMAQKVATGFLAVGPKMLACDDPQKMRMDIVDEQIDTTGRAFLGMTFGCARCHDHKFDPVTTKDYYGLAGIFMSTKTLVNYKVVAKWHEYDLSPPEIREAHETIAKLRREAEDKKASQEARDGARERMKALASKTPPLTKVMGVTENEITNARVHLRGSYLTLGEETPRQVPVVFHREPQFPAALENQSGRLELARWIGSAENPLTARVLVNRLWRWHFGKGLVSSTDNFGKLGSPPRHAPLLDYLATELVQGDWSIKRMQRLLTTSARYGLTTTPPPGEAEHDLEKVLPAYQPRQRLDAESLRDSLLGLAGALDLSMHGQLLKDQPGKYVNRSHLDDYLTLPRRSVYIPIVRSALYGAFVAFDMADPSAPNGDRRQSVVAPQSLYMMNSDRVHQTAAQLAERLPAEGLREKLDALYGRLLHRPASEADVSRAQAFLASYSGEDGWAALARAILASNEFLYLD